MLACLWRRKRARGCWQLSTSKSCAKASLLELSRKPFPSPPHFGDTGVIFSSEVRDSYQKKQFVHCERWEGRVGWGSQSMEVQWFPNMSVMAWMLYISVFCLILAVKESIAWAGKLGSVSHVPKWKLLIIPRPFLKSWFKNRKQVKSNSFWKCIHFQGISIIWQ